MKEFEFDQGWIFYYFGDKEWRASHKICEAPARWQTGIDLKYPMSFVCEKCEALVPMDKFRFFTRIMDKL